MVFGMEAIVRLGVAVGMETRGIKEGWRWAVTACRRREDANRVAGLGMVRRAEVAMRVIDIQRSVIMEWKMGGK